MNTKLTSTEALALVNAEYSHLGDAHHCKMLRRGFNDSYLVGIGSQWFVFRVYLNNKYYVDSTDAFQFEIDLLDHLRKAGCPVSAAVARGSNEKLGFTDTPQGMRAFALFEYAQGDEPYKKTITPELCISVGKIIANIHLAANSFESTHTRYHLDRKYLVDEPLRVIAEHIDKGRKNKENPIPENEVNHYEKIIESVQPVEELLEKIQSLDTSNDEFGIIHSDLHPGNLHLNGEQITVFDFDHCAYGWRAYELFITEFMPEEIKVAILKGYESVRPLSEAERECIPVFAKLRHLWDIGDHLAMQPAREE